MIKCQLYSTHITETDIALGDTSRLEESIAYIIEKDNPQVIFLLPSSIPQVIGTDLVAISQELQPLYPQTPLLPISYGGFNIKQHQGIKKALLLLAESLTIEIKKSIQPTFNILGSCADLLNFQTDVREIVRLLKGAFKMKTNCILTSEIRREGEATEKFLKEKFNTPYLLSRTYGIAGTKNWLYTIAQLWAVMTFLILQKKNG
ncbi:hypothetical protein AZF37_00695 [endosymbiont 'TC1' of Trimyema compressum]|uniref:nitrogenase component 1 n=1 Tax=endosymbiont 'TC1' of Trimyema compressum TaxID=243899 RepID=UPI0007F13CE0|nr:nitrogenase component 1 [endosymbiont 'TC1' of Trimyema compressum]AMP19891.1 hypothetical protein AZF37_00695 [endosymbiont 'TC1' of Trimyema compressum]